MKTTYKVTIQSIVHGRSEQLTITIKSIGKAMQKYANGGWIMTHHSRV